MTSKPKQTLALQYRGVAPVSALPSLVIEHSPQEQGEGVDDLLRQQHVGFTQWLIQDEAKHPCDE